MNTLYKPTTNQLAQYGLHWSPKGYAALTSDMLRWYHELDALFLGWAVEAGASQFQFPNLIDHEDLDRINYFDSFAHLATCVSESDCVLTPAACYHIYSALKNSEMPARSLYTTRANCFRRESEYFPLRRQWTFGMREIVCIGTESEVAEFIDTVKQQMADYFTKRGLPVRFEQATDPFFNPEKNPKYLMQLLDPVKLEMVFGGELAVGSFNKHRTTFGDAFGITAGGAPAHSACMAFGLERWIYMHLAACELDASQPITQWEVRK